MVCGSTLLFLLFLTCFRRNSIMCAAPAVTSIRDAIDTRTCPDGSYEHGNDWCPELGVWFMVFVSGLLYIGS